MCMLPQKKNISTGNVPVRGLSHRSDGAVFLCLPEGRSGGDVFSSTAVPPASSDFL